MAKKTDEKELEKDKDLVEETGKDIPIEIVDEESASDSGNVLQLLITYEQILNDITVDEYLAIQHYHIEESKKVLSRFIGNGSGRLLDPKDGLAMIGKISLTNLVKLIGEFFETMRMVAVPKENGSDSETT